jgi:predicted nuclease with TOPRIM domain
LQQQFHVLEDEHHSLSEQFYKFQHVKDRIQNLFEMYIQTTEKEHNQRINRLIKDNSYLQELVQQQEHEIQTLTQRTLQLEGLIKSMK